MNVFTPTDEQWEKMKRHIKSDRFKKDDFFVFETLAVGDRIVPNRYMRLTPELLETMKLDAQKGVSLMLNHNWSQFGVQSIPIGKVFDGRIGPSSQSGETTALYTTQYILRDDSKVDGYSKNDIIKLIESGILSDTSVGWGTTRDAYKCSICGNSIYDYQNCKHIPGEKYIVNEETNEVKECIIEAHSPKEMHEGNNVLMENSIVFDGAYPNAIIQSSVSEEVNTSNGNLKPLNGKEKLSEKDIIIGYSTSGNINLLYKESQEKGGLKEMSIKEEVTELENNNVTEDNENTSEVEESTEVVAGEVTEEVAEEETTATNESTDTTEAETENTEATENEVEATGEILYSEKDILEKFENISDNLDSLIALAKEGLENRNEVISEALESGVHSMGNAFNKEIFIKTFSNMNTKDIKEMGKTWEQQADLKFSKEKISKQDFSNNEEKSVIKVDRKMFKTDNY